MAPGLLLSRVFATVLTLGVVPLLYAILFRVKFDDDAGDASAGGDEPTVEGSSEPAAV